MQPQPGALPPGLTDDDIARLSGDADRANEAAFERAHQLPAQSPPPGVDMEISPNEVEEYDRRLGAQSRGLDMEIEPQEVLEHEQRGMPQAPPPQRAMPALPPAQPPPQQQGGITDDDIAALSGAADRAQQPQPPPQQQMPSWQEELERIPEGPSNRDMNRSWILSTIGDHLKNDGSQTNLQLRNQQLGERAQAQRARQGVLSGAQQQQELESQDRYRTGMLEQKGEGMGLREMALMLSGQRLGMQQEQGGKRIEQADRRLDLSETSEGNKGVRQDKQIENSQELAEKRIEAARVGREAAPGIHAETVKQDPVKRKEARDSYASLHVPLKRAMDSYQYLEKASPKTLELYAKLGNSGMLGQITNIAASDQDKIALGQLNELLVKGGWAEGGKNFTAIERDMMGSYVGTPVGTGFNPFQTPKVLKDYLRGLNAIRRERKKSAETTFGQSVWDE
jgi:hypothetical protein